MNIDIIDIDIAIHVFVETPEGVDANVLYMEDPDAHEQSLRASLIINGEEFKDSFDLCAFLRSGKTGDHYIFTCSCGIPGCASIWEGVHVKQRKHTVEWRFPPNAGYEDQKRKFYSFDKKAYNDLRTKLLDELKEIALDPKVGDQFSFSTVKDNLKYYIKAYNGKYWYED